MLVTSQSLEWLTANAIYVGLLEISLGRVLVIVNSQAHEESENPYHGVNERRDFDTHDRGSMFFSSDSVIRNQDK